jgi:hypothetical protein
MSSETSLRVEKGSAPSGVPVSVMVLAKAPHSSTSSRVSSRLPLGTSTRVKKWPPASSASTGTPSTSTASTGRSALTVWTVPVSTTVWPATRTEPEAGSRPTISGRTSSVDPAVQASWETEFTAASSVLASVV